MPKEKTAAKQPPETPARKSYESPRIQSERVFETHSLVTCGKTSGDPGCMPGGGPPDGIIGS